MYLRVAETDLQHVLRREDRPWHRRYVRIVIEILCRSYGKASPRYVAGSRTWRESPAQLTPWRRKTPNIDEEILSSPTTYKYTPTYHASPYHSRNTQTFQYSTRDDTILPSITSTRLISTLRNKPVGFFGANTLNNCVNTRCKSATVSYHGSIQLGTWASNQRSNYRSYTKESQITWQWSEFESSSALDSFGRQLLLLGTNS